MIFKLNSKFALPSTILGIVLTHTVILCDRAVAQYSPYSQLPSASYCEDVARDYARRNSRGGAGRGAANGAAAGAIGGLLFGRRRGGILRGAAAGAAIGAIAGGARRSGDYNYFYRRAFDDCMRGY